MNADSDGSTTADVKVDRRSGARTIWVRRAFLSLLAVIVLAGLTDLLGVWSRTVESSSPDGAVHLAVHYAQVARAGLDVPFQITVQQAGAIDKDVTIAVTSEYLDLFDRNGIEPEPAGATATGDEVIWRFEHPPGDTLEVSVDMQVQGGRHWGRSGTVAVLDETGSPIVQVQFKTWLAP